MHRPSWRIPPAGEPGGCGARGRLVFLVFLAWLVAIVLGGLGLLPVAGIPFTHVLQPAKGLPPLVKIPTPRQPAAAVLRPALTAKAFAAQGSPAGGAWTQRRRAGPGRHAARPQRSGTGTDEDHDDARTQHASAGADHDRHARAEHDGAPGERRRDRSGCDCGTPAAPCAGALAPARVLLRRRRCRDPLRRDRDPHDRRERRAARDARRPAPLAQQPADPDRATARSSSRASRRRAAGSR